MDAARFEAILRRIKEEGFSKTGASPLWAVRIFEKRSDAEYTKKRPKVGAAMRTPE